MTSAQLLSVYMDLEDRTTLNPSTIDVMVDSPSKKTKACTIQVALLWEFVSSEGGYLW